MDGCCVYLVTRLCVYLETTVGGVDACCVYFVTGDGDQMMDVRCVRTW